MESAVVKIIRGYELRERIGEGGFGAVHRAYQAVVDREVAVKVILPRESGNVSVADRVARFAREAAAARRLRSEHVARVLDAGTLPTGAPFLVMEFLEGCDLWTHMKKVGPMPVGTAVDVVIQVCDAIAEAHALGIIHRDLKPANMFLSMRADGSAFVKVLDFGISKAALTGSIFKNAVPLVKTVNLMGTPLYMSPEQVHLRRRRACLLVERRGRVPGQTDGGERHDEAHDE